MSFSLRLTAARLIPRCAYARPISTPTSGLSTEAETYNEAFEAVGLSAPPEIPPDWKITPRSFRSPRAPSYMNIPPAQDPLLHFFASNLMRHGHRTRASRITSRILLYLHAWTRAPPLPILREAIATVSPAVRTVSHKRAGKVISSPRPLSEKQRARQGIEWLIKASQSRPGRSIEERLAKEMIGVLQKESTVLKRVEENHILAMVNRYVICVVVELSPCS